MGIVRHDCESMPCALGSSGTVRIAAAPPAASPLAKTTLADESLTHSTHFGAASIVVTPGCTK